jgi:hypothetical protein
LYQDEEMNALDQLRESKQERGIEETKRRKRKRKKKKSCK